MEDPMELPNPQLGLRRRRRATVPDQDPAEAQFQAPRQNPQQQQQPHEPTQRVRRRWRDTSPDIDDANDDDDSDDDPMGGAPGGLYQRAHAHAHSHHNRQQFHNHHNHHHQYPQPPPRRRQMRVSHLYCMLSTVLAVLAIVAAVPASLNHLNTNGTNNNKNNNNHNLNSFAPTMPTHIPPPTQWATAEQVVKAAAVGAAARRGEIATDVESAKDLLQSIQQWWNMHNNNNYHHHNPSQQQQQQQHPFYNEGDAQQQQQQRPRDNNNNKSPHPWLKWITKSPNSGMSPASEDSATSATSHDDDHATMVNPMIHRLLQFIDPAIRNPTADTPTDIVEKVLTSTPRLLAIANFLLAMTYLLHSAIAAWFLGQQHDNNNNNNNNNQFQQQANNNNNGIVVDWSTSAGARERMGGFLVFKLLLISAVVAPDTLDLLILLTWYTLLSCLRSLDHLAHATTTHLAALGQTPRPGVFKLLLLVLTCNILAAASCVALFHAAGWGMVLLLTCDCALLAADVLSHILKHVCCVLDDGHSQTIQALEARQLELHNNRQQQQQQQHTVDGTIIIENENDDFEEPVIVEIDDIYNDEDDNSSNNNNNNNTSMSGYELQQESRRLDQKMEVLELAHARRLAILESVMFSLELLCHILTVAHFCHIWSLHGVQFTLIDGVLALHLHSAVSSACKKIAQRRNIHSIARDLQGLFPNASDQELRKASLAGDVCCICLGSMSTGGHVKKVRCGHLYHTHCLREVVERAQSIQAARCPLCRASVLDGRRDESGDVVRRTPPGVPPAAAAAATADATAVPQVQQQPQAQPQQAQQQAQQQPQVPPQQQQQQPAAADERALFRFSTEGFFPAWIPIPAFSFEVVRRPTQQTPGTPLVQQQQQQQQQPLPAQEAAQGGTAMADTAPREGMGNDVNNNENNNLPTANEAGPRSINTNNLGMPNNPANNPIHNHNDNINNNNIINNNNGMMDQGLIGGGGGGGGGEPQQQQQQASFLRRILVLAGAIPMSPEEEARALAQLVDMFPQYDRSDLLRELRERGSAESVAEAILMGIFSGVPRGD